MVSEEVLFIDGSYGEGGGQILRSALSLSILLRKPFRMINIRAGRDKPGLQRQHLTAVQACAQVSDAEVKQAELGSSQIEFHPDGLKFGDLKFDTGTAASTTLILQSLVPALSFGKQPTLIEITGGTNNPMAPSVLYFQNVFLPMVGRLGIKMDLEVGRYGWYPKGGGILRSRIEPITGLNPLRIADKGKLIKLWGTALISNLPPHIAEREKKQCLKNIFDMGLHTDPKIDIVQAPSIGQGTELFLCAEYEHSTAGFSSLGEIGKPAEKLADEVCSELHKFHESRAGIDPRLADQLLIYLALAKEKSEFTTSQVTNHLITNAWLIKQFLQDASITIEGNKGEKGKVTVEGVDIKKLD
jgi:RNA 3'-terminal phosphate cyclase (ATP)